MIQISLLVKWLIQYIYNSGKYYNLSGSLFTSLVSGDKKGTVVTDPTKTAGMFKNTVNAIDMSKKYR